MDVSIPFIIGGWFLVPWLIVASKIVRTSMYESQLGLTKNLPPSDFTERSRRSATRRKIDPEYDKMATAVKRWTLITIIWWLASFLLLPFALLFFDWLKS